MSIGSFWGPFLDGFTGAGFVRKLTIPGEPIPGFAPIQGTLQEDFLDRYRGHYWQIRFGKRNVKLKILDAWIDTDTGNLMFKVESVSGKVREVRVETDLLSPTMASAFEGSAR